MSERIIYSTGRSHFTVMLLQWTRALAVCAFSLLCECETECS